MPQNAHPTQIVSEQAESPPADKGATRPLTIPELQLEIMQTFRTIQENSMLEKMEMEYTRLSNGSFPSSTVAKASGSLSGFSSPS